MCIRDSTRTPATRRLRWLHSGSLRPVSVQVQGQIAPQRSRNFGLDGGSPAVLQDQGQVQRSDTLPNRPTARTSTQTVVPNRIGPISTTVTSPGPTGVAVGVGLRPLAPRRPRTGPAASGGTGGGSDARAADPP